MKDPRYPIGPFVAPEEISKQDRDNWIQSISRLPAALKEAVHSWNDEQLNTPYREGGWTVKSLLHHIADSHMNSIIRFKLGLTENNPRIKTYDQDGWSELYDSKQIDPSVSLSLLEAIHTRFVCLLKNMTDEEFRRTIFHPEMNKSISLEKMLALYGWHSEHHLAQILELKKEKKW